MNRQRYVENNRHVSLQQAMSAPTLTFNLQSIVVKTMQHKQHVWLNGIDKNGFSVAIKITDFAPTFMIRAPSVWDENDEDAAEELAELIDDIHEKTVQHGSSEKISFGEFVYFTPFIGFTNRRQDRMIKFVFYNLADMPPVIKYLKEARHTMYHEDFDPAIQFLQQTNFAYQDWITINDIKYTNSKLTHANMEGFCEMEQLTKASGDHGFPPILKAFMCLKAVSRDGVNEKQYSYKADCSRPFDRIVAIGISYVWTDHPPLSSAKVLN